MTAALPPSSRTTFFFPARRLMSQPTDAAGEADELDAVVGDQNAGVIVGKRQDVEATIGPARLLHALGQKQRAERSLGRRLQHHGTTGGDGRRDLVGDQIDRKIERRDAGDRAERETAHDAPAPGGELLPVEREIFAGDARAFLSGDVEGEDSALHFGARAFEGLAGFLCDGAGEFFLALCDVGGDSTQYTLTLKRRQAARGAESLDRGGDGGLGVLLAPLNDAGDEAAVVG